MSDAALPIAVFDSGVGGLTVLRALRAAMPEEDFIYLGDTGRLPYGTKSAATVQRYALNAAAHLVALDVKLLVVACNTASSFALPEGRKLDPRTPFGELGLDSLLAIELRNRIGKALGQRLPATLLFENPSLAELGTALMTELGLDEAPQMRPDKVTVTDVFEGLEDLSEAELEQLLGLDGNLDDEAEA